jgi:hypothetical protein
MWTVFGDAAGVVARGCFREWTWALERNIGSGGFVMTSR